MVPLRVLKSKMNAVRVILLPIRGENEFEPRPQNSFWYLLGVLLSCNIFMHAFFSLLLFCFTVFYKSENSRVGSVVQP